MKMQIQAILCFLLFVTNSSANILMDNPSYLPGSEFSNLTDKSQYNAADHAGSPLGWLEKDSSVLKTDLFFRYFRFSDEAGNRSSSRNLVIPHVRVGKPGIILFDLFYNPDILEIKSDFQNLKLPLHRFGFGLAAGTESGLFQFALHGDLFTGEESHDIDGDKRFILGSNEVSVHLGSKVHELVKIGLYGGISGYFDSLICEDPQIQDRFFSGAFPLFGGFIDFGKDQFPVRSNFSLGVGFPKFVYVTKPDSKPFGNQDVIRADSVGWDLKFLAEIPAANFSINPAFKVGYRRMTSQLYLPTEENNPWEYESKLSDSNWTVSSFGMGFALASDFLKYVNMNLEYSFKNLSFEYGPAYSFYSDQKYWYHHIVWGAQSNLKSLPFLRMPESMNFVLRAEYFNFRQSGFFDSWRTDQFKYVNVIANNSQSYRYSPEALTSAFRFAGFNLGTRAEFANGLFGVNADFLFLRDGFELGVKVTHKL